MQGDERRLTKRKSAGVPVEECTFTLAVTNVALNGIFGKASKGSNDLLSADRTRGLARRACMYVRTVLLYPGTHLRLMSTAFRRYRRGEKTGRNYVDARRLVKRPIGYGTVWRSAAIPAAVGHSKGETWFEDRMTRGYLRATS